MSFVICPLLMKTSRFPILIITVLLALLGLLAYLQFHWLGQISEGESANLKARLESDTKRFAEDFNREIKDVYFNFQIPSKDWKEKNWSKFNEQFIFWKNKTAYPELVKNFYFIETNEKTIAVYNPQTRAFETTVWNEQLDKIKPKIEAQNFQPIAEDIYALLMPVYEDPQQVRRIVIRTPETEEFRGVPPAIPDKFGFLVIELDEKVITEQLLPNLAKNYFSDSGGANYNLAVLDSQNVAVFQSQNLTATDATVKLFNLSPDNFVFLKTAETSGKTEGASKTVVMSSTSKLERRTLSEKSKDDKQLDIQVVNEVMNDAKPRVRVFEGSASTGGGIWTLNVQNTEGSLEHFITKTRRKNLAISFGILSLLAVSIILIFISSQRAKLFAQRQVDFVSSVSHEFRTPLAVIYSAGENLSDGVIRDEAKIANYGNLIKREGKKLSAMVEQILEFAGAKSGKRKYDFKSVEVGKIIEDAIGECRPLIEEKGFTLEKEIAENLPPISADKRALTQAVQNLIANSIKYSNGEKFVKISARNGGGKIKIAVEDKGLGIEKNELGKIFEPFYRSKKVVDAQIHGNGLGLSIVKQIVEAHDGKIEVESETGSGSKFTIELPQGS